MKISQIYQTGPIYSFSTKSKERRHFSFAVYCLYIILESEIYSVRPIKQCVCLQIKLRFLYLNAKYTLFYKNQIIQNTFILLHTIIVCALQYHYDFMVMQMQRMLYQVASTF